MKLRTIAFRNIRRNLRRSILSGTAIGIAAMVIVLVFAMFSGIISDMTGNVQRYLTGSVRVRNIEYDQNESLNPLQLRVEGYQDLLSRIAALPGVEHAVPRIEFGSAFYRDDSTVNAMGLAVDFTQERSILRLSNRIISGSVPENGERAMLLSQGLAKSLGAGPGDRLTLLGKNMYMGLSGMTFTVAGIVALPVSGMNSSYFFVPIPAAQTYLSMGDSVTELLVFGDSAATPEKLAAEISGILKTTEHSELHAVPWTAIGTYSALVGMEKVAYNVIALLFFLLGTTVIINTTIMVIYERVREIGTVAALGMTGGQIVRLFFLESLFISLISSATGVIVGVLITIPFAQNGLDLTSSLQGVDLAVSSVIFPKLNAWTAILVFIYSVVVSSIASFLPSRRSARVRPVEALRTI